MRGFRQAEGFLYCWWLIETPLISPARGGLLQGSIRHVMENILSIARGIASSSIGRKSILGVSFQLPILVHLL